MYSPLSYSNQPHKKTVSFSDNIQVQYFEKDSVLSSKKADSSTSSFSSFFILFLFFLFSLFSFFIFVSWKGNFSTFFSIFRKTDPSPNKTSIPRKTQDTIVPSDDLFESLRL